MARNITVTFEDGSTHVYQGAPDDITPEAVTARASNEFGKAVTALDGGRPAKPAEPKMGMLGNIGMGAIKGASNIGATLMRPVDWALNKAGLTDMTNAERRDSLKNFFNERADTDSRAFKGGEIGAGIAGTAGVGGLLAKGAMAAGGAIPAIAPYMPKVAAALQSGGFRTTPANFVGPSMAPTFAGKAADMALRTAAGGAVGGASAGLIDPETAGDGMMLGAALPGAVKVAGMTGRGIKNAAGTIAQNLLGLSTGTGANAIDVAYKAGKAGDTAFIRNMRGDVPLTDVLDEAKAALSNMRVNRGNEYRQGMAGVSADKTVLDLNPITDAVDNIRKMGSYKGQVINKNAAGTVEEIADQVQQWAKLDPADFHTPEGLDALKKAVGDIRDAAQFGTPARKAADAVYNTIKDQITRQAPTYAKTMKQYSDASDLITEIEKSLVGGNKTSADTAMRKLQSLMRNNVNTNYGNRLDLARELEQQGGKSLLPAIAGQAMSSKMPRGLQQLTQGATGVAGLGGMLDPVTALATMGAQSPRLVGEAVYGMGRMAGGAGNAAQGLLSSQQMRGLLTAQPYAPFMAIPPAMATLER